MINYEKNKEQEYVSPACKAFQIKMQTAVCQGSDLLNMARSSDTSDFERENFEW